MNGCHSQASFEVQVAIMQPGFTVMDITREVCDTDNDGSEPMELMPYESQITAAAVTFRYYTTLSTAENADTAQEISPIGFLLSGHEVLYVRAESPDQCHLVAVLDLKLVPVPVIAINPRVTLCQDGEISLSAGSGFDSYSWSTG